VCVDEFSASSAPLRFYLLLSKSWCLAEVIDESMQTSRQALAESLMHVDGCAEDGLGEFVSVGHVQPSVWRILKRRNTENAENCLAGVGMVLGFQSWIGFNSKSLTPEGNTRILSSAWQKSRHIANEFGEGRCMEFLHNTCASKLDGAQGNAQVGRDFLIRPTL
jgi:hypothetical protein